MTDLRKAAQALVDRWDTPLWKDVPHTGVFIDALRAALAEPEPCADEFDCDHMPWCRIRKTCQKQARAALAQPDESFCDSHCTWHDHHPDCALAQPEPEPVAYQWLGTSVIRKRIPKGAEADAWKPLYAQVAYKEKHD